MNVAFIPVRGGSKSIPLKNIKPICGRPLVYWTVKAACECNAIDKVYIATDSEPIKKAVEDFANENASFSKIQVIGRSEESASDTASTESVMLEFAEEYEFDNIVLIQATSPLLTSEDLDKGFELFAEDGVDTVLSAVRQKRFNWAVDENGLVEPTNYDVFKRPRRQEFDGYLVENGAFYISSKENLVKYKNRLSGRIKAVEMAEDSFFEIDEPSDWIIIEALMKKNGLAEKIYPDHEVKMFLTDCDGCLTDGGMYYSENGDELKKFNTKDGLGFSLIRKKGIITGIVTGEDRELNRRRAKKLQLDEIISGCKNKLEAVRELCEKYDIFMENVLYVGDDLNDLELLSEVGFSCCPADANNAIKEVVDFVSEKNGGDGVIRDVIDYILGN